MLSSALRLGAVQGKAGSSSSCQGGSGGWAVGCCCCLPRYWAQDGGPAAPHSLCPCTATQIQTSRWQPLQSQRIPKGPAARLYGIVRVYDTINAISYGTHFTVMTTSSNTLCGSATELASAGKMEGMRAWGWGAGRLGLGNGGMVQRHTKGPGNMRRCATSE